MRVAMKRKALEDLDAPLGVKREAVEVLPRITMVDVGFVLETDPLYQHSQFYLRQRALENVKEF